MSWGIGRVIYETGFTIMPGPIFFMLTVIFYAAEGYGKKMRC
jgi:hypothetical protein